MWPGEIPADWFTGISSQQESHGESGSFLLPSVGLARSRHAEPTPMVWQPTPHLRVGCTSPVMPGLVRRQMIGLPFLQSHTICWPVDEPYPTTTGQTPLRSMTRPLSLKRTCPEHDPLSLGRITPQNARVVSSQAPTSRHCSNAFNGDTNHKRWPVSYPATESHPA
jgi:hypothetical protein